MGIGIIMSGSYLPTKNYKIEVILSGKISRNSESGMTFLFFLQDGASPVLQTNKPSFTISTRPSPAGKCDGYIGWPVQNW